LKNIINAYKRKAYREMLDEYPEVKNAIKSAIKQKYGMRKKMSISEIKKGPKEFLPR
jgi:hemoglobin-like flavoprotein